MKKTFIAAAAVLSLAALPGAAFASKTNNPGHSGTITTPSHTKKVPTVMFVLHGTLSNYTAYSKTTPPTPSISITVTSSNFDRASLKASTQPLVFGVTSKTIVVLHNDNPITTGDRGIVKVRAPKTSKATDLQNMTAFQVIDQGAAK